MLSLLLAIVSDTPVSKSLHQSAMFFTDVPKTWPHQKDLLTWCQQMTPGVAALLILVGIVYLLFGFQIFKGLVLVNAAVVGAYVGAYLGQDGDAADGLRLLKIFRLPKSDEIFVVVANGSYAGNLETFDFHGWPRLSGNFVERKTVSRADVVPQRVEIKPGHHHGGRAVLCFPRLQLKAGFSARIADRPSLTLLDLK